MERLYRSNKSNLEAAVDEGSGGIEGKDSERDEWNEGGDRHRKCV
jgi:hypothetical protein